MGCLWDGSEADTSHGCWATSSSSCMSMDLDRLGTCSVFEACSVSTTDDFLFSMELRESSVMLWIWSPTQCEPRTSNTAARNQDRPKCHNSRPILRAPHDKEVNNYWNRKGHRYNLSRAWSAIAVFVLTTLHRPTVNIQSSDHVFACQYKWCFIHYWTTWL